jgi:hypothetical protein
MENKSNLMQGGLESGWDETFTSVLLFQHSPLITHKSFKNLTQKTLL